MRNIDDGEKKKGEGKMILMIIIMSDICATNVIISQTPEQLDRRLLVPIKAKLSRSSKKFRYYISYYHLFGN